MADWSMEPAAGWVPSGLQLANSTTEPAVCSTGLPMEYACTEIFSNFLQTSVPVSKGGRQLVEYAVSDDREYDQMETSEKEFVVLSYNMEKIIRNYSFCVFEEVAKEFRIDIDKMRSKIHRYPASINALCLSERYTIPLVVSIGPYHHDREYLKKAEKAKHVAAYNCILNSGHTVDEMYNEVVQAAHYARGLYDNDVMAGISDDDFLPMMFFDACFLVQYMLTSVVTDGSVELDDSLCSFIDSSDNEIYHDIMLLENQIPWFLVQAVMKFGPVPLQEFIYSLKGCLQDRKESEEKTVSIVNYDEPPHLLGLVRFHVVGENRRTEQEFLDNGTKQDETPDSVSFSVSAVELAEIGVTLKPARETTELSHMGFNTKGTLFAELSLAPLSLDSSRASSLINVAALELCMTSNFGKAEDEESAVCSYLLLLAMLVSREEDVQELRTQRILQGGGGLSNAQALDFFTRSRAGPAPRILLCRYHDRH